VNGLVEVLAPDPEASSGREVGAGLISRVFEDTLAEPVRSGPCRVDKYDDSLFSLFASDRFDDTFVLLLGFEEGTAKNAVAEVLLDPKIGIPPVVVGARTRGSKCEVSIALNKEV